ncbi:MAG: 30S ribosome-binding factor RbfA [Proteobacteria bacterium]|jgi:ribosome-binding factor A|nr:30S ribosome-binding factor RbfA [Pseudomonadota bacterium]
MKEHGRALRIADHLREQLADIIRAEMRDPRVGMVSVNDVRVSRDLAYADVFVSALGVDDPQSQREFIKVLEHAAGFLRSAVARDNTLRTTPKLRFHYDELIVEGARIETLIRRAVAADEDSQRRRGDED